MLRGSIIMLLYTPTANQAGYKNIQNMFSYSRIVDLKSEIGRNRVGFPR